MRNVCSIILVIALQGADGSSQPSPAVQPSREVSKRDVQMQLKDKLVDAIKNAMSEIRAKHPKKELHGFALCTDDSLMTLYLVSCTKEWMAKREKENNPIGSIYVEWKDRTGSDHFDPISKQMAKMWKGDAFGISRDLRFGAIVEALKECRNKGVFDKDTLVCCGSTDPSPHLEALTMRAVDQLNEKAVADKFAKHLGYERYR